MYMYILIYKSHYFNHSHFFRVWRLRHRWPDAGLLLPHSQAGHVFLCGRPPRQRRNGGLPRRRSPRPRRRRQAATWCIARSPARGQEAGREGELPPEQQQQQQQLQLQHRLGLGDWVQCYKVGVLLLRRWAIFTDNCVRLSDMIVSSANAYRFLGALV